jgi:hypothetical protein
MRIWGRIFLTVQNPLWNSKSAVTAVQADAGSIRSIPRFSEKPPKPGKFFCCESMRLAANRSKGLGLEKSIPYPITG